KIKWGIFLMEYFQSDFFDLVDLTIKINKNNRNIEASYLLPLDTYYHEYCSIDINLGRQTGKTSYIKSHANFNSLVISHRITDKTKKNYMYCSHHHLNENSNAFRGISLRHIDTVYIDEGSFLSKQQRKNLYANIAICSNHKKDITFVFLG
uniref:hypothetical protein n=1 Tax=Flavobacterium sp. TaxID=239 RepID=UPI00261DEEA2